jgi:cell division protein FtsX
MSRFFFLLGDLLGTINAKSGVLFLALLLLTFSSLALFSSFFLLGTTVSEESTGPALAPREILLHLSPRLSSEAVEDLYLQIRDRDDVREITYRFPQELGLSQVEGIFLIQAVSVGAVTPLIEELSTIEGVVRVDSLTGSQKRALSLSTPLKIGLLVGLALSILGSLIVARRAFAELLRGFAEEIRMMRLAGTSEGMIHLPIIVVGILCGVVAGFLLIVVIYLFHSLAITHPETLLHAASGLVDSGRVLTVSMVGFLLGLILGGLHGVLGASLTESGEFQVYS